MPAPSRRCCIHSGDGPIFTFLSIRVEKREHKSGSAISTEKISFNLVLSSILWYSLFLILFAFVSYSAQATGIFESYAVLNINGGGNTYYDLQATTGTQI